MLVLTLDSATFDETVLSSDRPVLVDFWATWCGPCQVLSPLVEELASSETRLLVAKVDVDEEPELARRFDVMSVPTLIVFKDGAPRTRLVGARGLAQLRADVEPFL